jgi:hypothetical protein
MIVQRWVRQRRTTNAQGRNYESKSIGQENYDKCKVIHRKGVVRRIREIRSTNSVKDRQRNLWLVLQASIFRAISM